MKLYNSLTRQVENFEPISESKKVGMYTCGPTVYFYPHIGNWRTFVLGDLVARALVYLGYELEYVMNITDVGHLTGDNLGDASTGEDRLEKGAKREGKTAWQVAEFYTKDFLDGFKKLNLVPPTNGRFCKATDHIPEQIDMVSKIEDEGFAYTISDGVYFDVKAYEAAGNSYGLMSNIHKDNVEARIEENTEKRDFRDFALWKFSPKDEMRQMEWDSPWGKGFPGWHIECSAMSTKYLGEQFDIHIGGEDHKSTHHPNEIAQAEAATGKKPFVKYWVHGAFLTVDGGRMGKSLGNAYTLADLAAKGFSPIDLRYLYLTAHYRKQLNFTWEGLMAAKKSLVGLKEMAIKFPDNEAERTVLSEEKLAKIDDYRTRFRLAIEDDLNMPEALAVMWEMVKSNVPSKDKRELLIEFDQVLGFGVAEWNEVHTEISGEIQTLIDERAVARESGDYERADLLRKQIAELGFEVIDTAGGQKIQQKIS